jgi:hypothetical protein
MISERDLIAAQNDEIFSSLICSVLVEQRQFKLARIAI